MASSTKKRRIESKSLGVTDKVRMTVFEEQKPGNRCIGIFVLQPGFTTHGATDENRNYDTANVFLLLVQVSLCRKVFSE